MLRMTAREIADAVQGRIIAGSDKAEATSCVVDSRQVRPGALFAAFVGEHADGHDYIEAATQAGATVILASREVNAQIEAAVILVDDVLRALQDLARHQRSKLDIPIIGITGSIGKTSTKEMLKTALDSSLRVVATEANYNNELGVPLTVLSADETTEVLVVEMGMRARGEIAFLADIVRPQIGIITQLGEAHIERLGSRENIARTKSELFEVLPDTGLAIYPDDIAFRTILEASTRAQKHPIDIRTRDLSLKLMGRHNVENALLALDAALYLGLDEAAVLDAIAHLEPTGMRLSAIDLSHLNIRIINDAYNASPDSTAAALKTLAALETSGKRIAVLGDMLELGNTSERAHCEILDLATELDIDIVFTLGENFAHSSKRRGDTDMDALLHELRSVIEPSDVVLVKGSRGMRMERIVDALTALDMRRSEC